MKKYIRSNDYMMMKRNYKNMKEFRDKEKQSGELRDLLDRLDGSGVSYDIYDNNKTNGCTVFYDDINSSVCASRELSPKAARKICNSAWAYDAVKVALNYLSDKLEGYDDYGDGFDVSYVGDTTTIRDELFDVLVSAGLEAKKQGQSKITYNNDGTVALINIFPDEDASTYSENSTGYFITVEDIYGIDDPDEIDWDDSADDEYWSDEE